MSAWEDDYLDEEVEAFIEFEEKGGGSFQFGYVQGLIVWRLSTREGEPAVEWSWEGGDGADGTPLTGRGWAVLKDDGLHAARARSLLLPNGAGTPALPGVR